MSGNRSIRGQNWEQRWPERLAAFFPEVPLSLGEALSQLGAYELLDHRTQGEFHHDVVLGIEAGVMVIATNCNGGIKEVLLFDSLPSHDALWRWRCPDNEEFEAELLPVLSARGTTVHFFNPCELLLPDARSELRQEFRKRQRGGGWTSSE